MGRKTIKTLKTHNEAFNFFEKIPEENWTTGKFGNDGCYCMYGHCGINDRNYIEDKEGKSPALIKTGIPKLLKVFKNTKHPTFDFWLTNINDAVHKNQEYNQLGDTPKDRVLNAIVLASSGIMEDL